MAREFVAERSLGHGSDIDMTAVVVGVDQIRNCVAGESAKIVAVVAVVAVDRQQEHMKRECKQKVLDLICKNTKFSKINCQILKILTIRAVATAAANEQANNEGKL